MNGVAKWSCTKPQDWQVAKQHPNDRPLTEDEKRTPLSDVRPTKVDKWLGNRLSHYLTAFTFLYCSRSWICLLDLLYTYVVHCVHIPLS